MDVPISFVDTDDIIQIKGKSRSTNDVTMEAVKRWKSSRRLQTFKLMKLMAPNFKMITIIRKPRSQFESAFSHFNAGGSMGLRPLDRNTTLTEDLTRFLTNPAFYWSRASWFARWYTRNGQLYDLADTDNFGSTEEVSRMIRHLDRIIDLVLIAEYFDESLVIFRRLMCWDFKDIVYITQNAREEKFRSDLTAEQEARLGRWNFADSILYDYFNQSLWAKIARYGPGFQRDLAHFRRLLKEYQRTCTNGTIVRSRGNRVKLVAANNSTFCKQMVDDNYQTEKLIIERQNGVGSC
ncbi:galactosylceramide sulfotransferase-like [Lytechinus variegatus]|uniref:galactosylceramide sulfotransferase-like n=1 Tax=Lytechinus variegatus TaxID=7654 RepID=UPI001BB10739|nr:galactosylceramide sulfotransferase-like [Lytechinus variegatus]